MIAVGAIGMIAVGAIGVLGLPARSDKLIVDVGLVGAFGGEGGEKFGESGPQASKPDARLVEPAKQPIEAGVMFWPPFSRDVSRASLRTSCMPIV